jgi:hypothetical protein
MPTRAYALKPEYKGTTSLSVAGYNGETVDLGALLSDGKLSTDDEALQVILNESSYVEPVGADTGQATIDESVSSDNLVIVSEGAPEQSTTAKGDKN